MGKVARALISVTNKEGIVDFARGLAERGVEIMSTGGTARVLAAAGIQVKEIADVSGFPEILDGRVKTLHPKVHGGILARRSDPAHRAAMAEQGIAPIDLVAVNLYAFEAAAKKEGARIDEVIEEIDIGGPTLLRAAAKNHEDVVVLVDPADYPRVLAAIAPDGESSLDLGERRRLALEVFRHTARYDRTVAEYLAKSQSAPPPAFPESFSLELVKLQDLRYGENPHQRAAFYRELHPPPGALATARQLAGKPLSFNNLLDADSALALAIDLGEDSAVFVKHNNPCGAARHADVAEAIQIARACDPVSAFGAVVAVGKQIGGRAAEALAETFIEVIVAPSYSEEALEILTKKKNLRLLEIGGLARPPSDDRDLRRVGGGLLVQDRDARLPPKDELAAATVVTQRAPADEERAALEFAWIVVKHVRSNAIVFARSDRIVAVGAGQMSRVDAVRLCEMKGGEALAGTAVASDAFFPFRDGVDILARTGATAVVQPGGSVRDEEVILAADEHGLAMLATGVRHFRH